MEGTSGGKAIARWSLWRCRTVAGHCVVRVEGGQTALEGGEGVLVLPAIRGADRVTFEGGAGPRMLDRRGFLRRYVPMSEEGEALELVRTTRPLRLRHDRRPRARHDARQVLIPGAEGAHGTPSGAVGAVEEIPWAFDAIVLHAGIGGAAEGLRRAGWRALGLEPQADLAAAHRANVGPCLAVEPGAWAPYGRAELVFCAQPTAGGRAPEDPSHVDTSRLARLKHAVALATEVGARAVVIEVAGGKRGTRGDLQPLRLALGNANFTAFETTIDPAYLGLPQTRPTTLLVGTREARRPAWPLPTHAPPGNLGGMRSFVTLAEALGLTEVDLRNYQGPDARSVAPTLGARGFSALFGVPEGALGGKGGHPPTPAQMGRVQGLPETFLGPEEADGSRLRAAFGTALPPLLAEMAVRAVCPEGPTKPSHGTTPGEGVSA